jgi:hypothetical protein
LASALRRDSDSTFNVKLGEQFGGVMAEVPDDGMSTGAIEATAFLKQKCIASTSDKFTFVNR